MLTIAANSVVQFKELRMGWDDASNSTNATLNVGSNAHVTFSGAAYLGNQGNANINLASGSVLNLGFAYFNNVTNKSTIIKGVGQLNVTGELINNGRVVADGGTLAVTAGSINHNNVYGTMGDSTRPGWYAINAGKLTLPTVTINNGGNVNIGERSSLGSLDGNSLVNSVRITGMTGGSLNGTLAVSYLDPTNPGAYAGLTGAVSIWDFNPAGGLSVNTATLAFRYDTTLVNGTEGSLNLYENAGTGWQLIPGGFGGSLFTTNTGAGSLNSTAQFALAQGIVIAGSTAWAGGSDTLWATGANWGGSAPSTGDILHFDGANVSTSNDVAANTAFGGVVFDGGAGSFTVSGNAITLGGNITNSSASNQNITLNMALSYSKTKVDTGVSNMTIAGALSNASGSTPAALIKLGSGNLTLTGTNSNTGSVRISAGTLSVDSIGNGGISGNLGAASSDASNLVFDGGTLEYTGGSTTTDRLFTINPTKAATFDLTQAGTTLTLSGAPGVSDGALVKNGPGTLTLTGASFYSGSTTVNGGLLNIGIGGAGASIRSCEIVLASNATVKFNHSNNQSVGSEITGTGNFIKDGGGTLTLTAANSYVGSTTVENGTLKIANAAALANYATAVISVNNTSTMAVNVGLAAPKNWSTAEMNAFLGNGNVTFASGAFFGIDTTGGNFTIATGLTTVRNVQSLGRTP